MYHRSNSRLIEIDVEDPHKLSLEERLSHTSLLPGRLVFLSPRLFGLLLCLPDLLPPLVCRLLLLLPCFIIVHDNLPYLNRDFPRFPL